MKNFKVFLVFFCINAVKFATASIEPLAVCVIRHNDMGYLSAFCAHLLFNDSPILRREHDILAGFQSRDPFFCTCALFFSYSRPDGGLD